MDDVRLKRLLAARKPVDKSEAGREGAEKLAESRYARNAGRSTESKLRNRNAERARRAARQ